MTFAQRRNGLTTHFWERMPVVKRRLTIFYASFQATVATYIRSAPHLKVSRNLVPCPFNTGPMGCPNRRQTIAHCTLRSTAEKRRSQFSSCQSLTTPLPPQQHKSPPSPDSGRLIAVILWMCEYSVCVCLCVCGGGGNTGNCIQYFLTVVLFTFVHVVF